MTEADCFIPSMEGSINLWMAQNRGKAEGISMKVIHIHREFLEVQIGGNMIQVIIPSTFYSESRDTVSSDSVFLAICLETGVDETLKEALVALNEKLERVRIDPNSLNKVLDNMLHVFEYYCKWKKLDTSAPGSPSNEEHEREWAAESLRRSSFLCKLAEEGRVQCEEALSKADECSIVDEILPWCSVSVDPGSQTVEMEIEISGLMACDDVATALGFCFDSPLRITLSFSHCLWSAQELRRDLLGTTEVAVSQTMGQLRNMESSMQAAVDGLDESIKRAASRCCLNRVHQYGPQVLVAELVKEFFDKLTKEMVDDNAADGLGKATGSENIVVGLLNFIGSHLSTLGSWCIICRNALPPFSRLWYCNAELCLYKLEELGLGASVLQDLQNSEMIDLELRLAAAAAGSSRDVFEPYPTFLLRKREIRGRSGYFSNFTCGKSTETSEASKSGKYGDLTGFQGEVYCKSWTPNLANKQLDILNLLIKSFPPVEEMQKCANECELRVKLAISWRQTILENTKTYGYQHLENGFAENLWLPYNALRFVLFTNRLSLHLLEGESLLKVPGSFYQFTVLYDSKQEEYFESCRAAKGSIFAFHGSDLGNWYSILRNGLRCLSNTEYMSSGMAGGTGIYFSSEMDVSRRYCVAGSGWSHGKLKECSVMAICEIFSGQTFLNNCSYLVVPPELENQIAIRYLITFNRWDDANKGVSITDGHLLAAKKDLHKHYDQLRAQHLKNLVKKNLISKHRCLVALEKRKASANCSHSVISMMGER